MTAPDDNLDCVLPVAQGLSAPGGGSRASGSRSTVYRPKHYEITNQLLARSNTTCVQYTDGALDGQQWVSWNAESVDVSQHSTSSAESCPAPNSTDLSNCNYDIPSCGYVCGSTSADYSRDCLSCYPDTCVNNYSRDIGVTWKSSVTALGGAAGYTIEMSGIEMGLDGSWGLMGTYNVVATSPCDSATLNFDVTLENTVDNSTRRINEFYGEATSERLKVTVTLTPNTTEDTGPSGTHINGCHHNGTCLCDSSG